MMKSMMMFMIVLCATTSIQASQQESRGLLSFPRIFPTHAESLQAPTARAIHAVPSCTQILASAPMAIETVSTCMQVAESAEIADLLSQNTKLLKQNRQLEKHYSLLLEKTQEFEQELELMQTTRLDEENKWQQDIQKCRMILASYKYEHANDKRREEESNKRLKALSYALRMKRQECSALQGEKNNLIKKNRELQKNSDEQERTFSGIESDLISALEESRVLQERSQVVIRKLQKRVSRLYAINENRLKNNIKN